MLALLQIAFIRVYVLTVIMALVVVEKLLWLDMHNGSRQLKEVISDLTVGAIVAQLAQDLNLLAVGFTTLLVCVLSSK